MYQYHHTCPFWLIFFIFMNYFYTTTTNNSFNHWSQARMKAHCIRIIVEYLISICDWNPCYILKLKPARILIWHMLDNYYDNTFRFNLNSDNLQIVTSDSKFFMIWNIRRSEAAMRISKQTTWTNISIRGSIQKSFRVEIYVVPI